ncbi:MAG TPA: O-antigen ligase family protein [bacterium]|nr:O-antigen ligase family protein [bacterium]HOL46744.1 O-antigen ligase family protein [bacterium]HPQ18180.1 O-antigen ligase family protein [bacterium]
MTEIKKISSYFFILIIFIITYIFSTKTRSIVALKTLLFYFLMIIFLCYLLFYSLIKKQVIILKISEIHLPFLIYFLYSIINLITLLQYKYINLIWCSAEYIYNILNYFLLLIFIFTFINSSQIEIRKYLLIIVYLSILPVLFGILQHFNFFEKNNIYVFKLLPASVASSTFGNKNFFAGYLIMIIPLCFYFIFSEKNKKKIIIFTLIFFLNFFALIITYTRGAYVGFFSAILLILILNINYFIKNYKYLFLSVILIFLILIILIFNFELLPRLKEAIISIFSFSTGTNLMRVTIYKSFFRAIIAKPLFGVGVGTFQYTMPFFRDELFSLKGMTVNEDHAHNEIIEIGGEEGIIGLGLFLWFFVIIYFLAIKKIIKTRNNELKILIISLLASITAYFVHNLFSIDLRIVSTSVLFYFLIGLIICLIKEKEISIKINYQKIMIIIIIPISIYLSYFLFSIYKAQKLLQISTSYERSDSVFIDETGKHSEKIRNDKLIEIYKKVIENNKYCLDAKYKLASAYYRNNYFDEALKEYKEILYYAPRYCQTFFNISLIYFMKKNNEQINKRRNLYEALYYQMLAADMEFSSKNFKQLSSFFYEAQKIELSILYLKKAIKLDRKNTDLYNILGFRYFEKQDYINALNTYYQLINSTTKRDINYIEAYKNIGVIYYYYLKNNEKAKIYFEKYIELTENEEEKIKVNNLLKIL